MDEWLARLLTVTYPVVIVCGSGLLAYWMKLRHARRMTLDHQQFEQLSAHVEALRADLDLAVTELNERLDFAERLLARGTAPLSEESRDPTPV